MQGTLGGTPPAAAPRLTGGFGGEIARQLPYLRRYARAITGSQRSGDESVRRALEALLARRDELAPAHLRRELFRALLKVWSDDGDAGASGTSRSLVANGSILVSRLAELGTTHRQLLLLTTLEGMSVGDAADILDLEPADAGRQLERARGELFEQSPTDVLIIEDEPVIAMDIASMVGTHGHRVIGIARTRDEAVRLAETTRPGLILADIHLADDSTGIDAVHDILESTSVPVIFITAFPEMLLTGDRPEPTFLITKPFDPDTLAISIAQALASARIAGLDLPAPERD